MVGKCNQREDRHGTLEGDIDLLSYTLRQFGRVPWQGPCGDEKLLWF